MIAEGLVAIVEGCRSHPPKREAFRTDFSVLILCGRTARAAVALVAALEGEMLLMAEQIFLRSGENE